MDRKHFFDAVRASVFGGSLTQAQVKGMEALPTIFASRIIHLT